MLYYPGLEWLLNKMKSNLLGSSSYGIIQFSIGPCLDTFLLTWNIANTQLSHCEGYGEDIIKENHLPA